MSFCMWVKKRKTLEMWKGLKMYIILEIFDRLLFSFVYKFTESRCPYCTPDLMILFPLCLRLTGFSSFQGYKIHVEKNEIPADIVNMKAV